MAKLSVALCITELDFGGAEQALVELATRLDRSHFDPIVYCLGPRPKSEEASCVPPLEAAGIEVHCLGGRGILSVPMVLFRLRRLLRKQRPHLLQSFLFHANLLGRLAARRAGVPWVLSGIRVAERQHGWHLRLDRLTSSMVDRYVCVSQAVADFSAKTGGLPEDRLAVIPNGIDPQKYPAKPADLRPLGIEPGRCVVTWVGRFDPQKGVKWLVQNAAGWLGKLSGHDLLLVGKGPEQAGLQRWCQQQEFGPRVHFAGWRSDVPQLLAASQILVLPSRWEGMPNVVLQAMASGLPVVATDVEGVRELLGPTADKQTVPWGDSAALASRIIWLAGHPHKATQLGQKNQLRAHKKFSLDQTVRAYETLWESLFKAPSDEKPP